MSRSDRRRLKETLQDFHEWIEGTETDRCRLVQYRSLDLISAEDVPSEQIDDTIEQVVTSGQQIQWAISERCLYFRVWEDPGPEPSWEMVFAERSLVVPGDDLPDDSDDLEAEGDPADWDDGGDDM